MKTANLEPDGNNAAAVTRGRKGPKRATSDMLIRDDDGNEVLANEILLIGLELTDDDDGTAIISGGGGTTIVGGVEVDPASVQVTISSGADHRAFPGVAWLDDPTATTHGVGDRFLIVYRHGASHLTGGKIVGKIATVTTPWTFTLGSEFDIEDVANDARCHGDALSVIDIDGAGNYRAVVSATEYNGTVNLSPHVLVCDDSSDTMTSVSTWTRYAVALSAGATQNLVAGRVLRLQNGTYMLGAYWISGATNTTGVLLVSDPTDWSAPTLETISVGYNEIGLEEMPDGTLFAHLRDVANTFHFSSTSTDSGATWSAPTSLYAAEGYPMWRRLNSGIGFTIYRSDDGSFDTAYRQTQTADTDTGWSDETLLDTTASYQNAYATILQLDDNNVLAIWATEADGADPVDSDIFAQVFTDSTIFGSAGLTIQDEGTSLATTATSLNFVGDGVTASGSGAAKTITIPGVSETSGHYEVLMTGASPAEPLEDGSGTDWLYVWVT